MGRTIDVMMNRVSVRSYAPQPIAPEVERDLRAAILREADPGPLGTAPRFVIVGAEETLELGRLGTYGVIRGASLFVIGVVAPGERAMEDFGYRFEGVVLEAASLGLGTCWLAGTFSRSAAARIARLTDAEIVPAVTPIGYAAEHRSLVDGALRFVARSATRLPFGSLFFDGSTDRPLTPEAAGRWSVPLECVQRAPSASNRQPWRIVLERGNHGERLHLFLAENPSYNRLLGPVRIQNIDMGIAMRHFAEAAAELGLCGSWSTADPPPAAPGLAYVATWA